MDMTVGMEEGKKKLQRTFTDEQIAIIQSSGNLRINAVAGSGKTTTLIEYAATRPPSSRILYLAFNKSVKLEAIRKFEARGLHNVTVETSHSLAYRHIVRRHGYSVRQQDFRPQEIADILGLSNTGERHAEHIIASHIRKFITYFCNSSCSRVQELNYADIISDQAALSFVRSFYRMIEDGTRQLLAEMNNATIPVTHDFYLKKFQLSKPVLPYDYILFDEGQDASPAMLDIFKKQSCTRLIVGDTHQQIYRWRHAVNSLEQVDFPSQQLTNSFRFGKSIATLATNVIGWKNYLRETLPITLTGKGTATEVRSKAIIARTNLGLLLSAITYINLNKKTRHIYFEGNINSYTYADEGASLYDVLNLYNERHDQIRDPIIRNMKDMDDLEDFVEKTEDMQLSMMAEIVKEYGNDIYPLLQTLKNLHTGDDEREKAEVIFSTVHRAKGMEYDSVELVADFITEARLQKPDKDKEKNEDKELDRLNEEINLLYVAITRAKVQLRIPESLLPQDYTALPGIIVIPGKNESRKQAPVQEKKFIPPADKRKLKFVGRRLKTDSEHKPSGYKPWTTEQENELRDLYEKQLSITEIASYFDRTPGAISSRLKKLNYFM